MASDRHLAETMKRDTAECPPQLSPAACAQPCVISKQAEDLVRNLLVRFGDKWSMRVMDELYERGALRFTRLRDCLPGVSQKMLTQTLRQLERDGVVARRVYAEVPPRVDYELTPIGIDLAEALCGVWEWAMKYEQTVAGARQAYDGQMKAPAKDGSPV
jgi:DNA-binding HxlR family transcriptional regulator